MFEKKHVDYKTPDLNKLQEVKIDSRTKIYIPIDADPIEAKVKYLSKFGDKIMK